MLREVGGPSSGHVIECGGCASQPHQPSRLTGTPNPLNLNLDSNKHLGFVASDWSN